MRYFVFVSSLWVSRDSSIQEVWCGRNSAEPSQNIKPFIDSMMDLWNIMHPNVLFKHPLDHLSKKEQWDLIPLEIKSYISSCCTANNCGKCFKCRELVENNIPQ
jgi:hypothetical protein